MKITVKQKRFCEEYLIDLNGTQAAIRAGYSKRTANEQAARLLTKVSLQEYIRILKKERSERLKITADDVLENLERAIKLSLGIEESLVVVREGVGKGLTSTSVVPMKKTDLSAYIKINEMYMRHLGMNKDTLEVSVDEKIANWMKQK